MVKLWLMEIDIMIRSLARVCPVSLAVAALLSFGGCSDIIYNNDVVQTASVQLEIPVPDNLLNAKAVIEDSDAEAAIRQLRVLIFAEDENVDGIYEKEVCNRAFSAEEIASGTIIIENVPLGKAGIYVVANEASIGKDYTDTQTWRNDVVSVGNERKILIVDESDPRKFPMKAVPDFQGSHLGLPMSWFTDAEIGSGENKFNVELRRAVSKINLNIQHEFKRNLIINTIAFGKFFGDRFYLFQEGERLEVPGDSKYESRTYDGLNIELPSGEQVKTLSLYVYPSFAYTPGQPSAYTIGFTTSEGGFPAKSIGITQLLRNTVLDVNVYLSETNLTFSFNVRDWTEKDIEVPPFN